MSEPLLESLTRFIIKALNGERPAMFAELFLSARLLPFKKKDAGVRPIAVGEVLSRLGAKVALHQIMPVIQEKMPPLQLGVAVSDSVAHLTHAVRCAHQLCLENSSAGILQVDISNAFNTIQRQAILDSVFAEFPQIFPLGTVVTLQCRRSPCGGHDDLFDNRGSAR